MNIRVHPGLSTLRHSRQSASQPNSELSCKPRPRLGSLFALGLGISSGLLVLSSPALAQEQLLRTLTVTGQGTESVQTTLIQARLGVEVQGKTAGDVQQQAAQRSATVVELLRSRNVQKLETTGIRLNPVYSFTNQRRQLTGYSATNTVSFQIPTEAAGTILDDAVKAGATRIDGVSFIASETAISTARQEALREATQDAQQQASAVLGALGFTQKEIVAIQVNGAAAPIRPPLPFARLESESDAATPVIGGEQDVRASVTLQIRY